MEAGTTRPSGYEERVTEARRLDRTFYAAEPARVARALLGKVLVHLDAGDGSSAPVRRAARIVETEAYGGEEDLASHARFGRTPRSAVMFGPPGHAYVYLVYGLSHCFNVVTGREGRASAVLVRAAEPVEGCLHATTGPGNLCRALAIHRRLHDGADLTAAGAALWLEDAPPPRQAVAAGPRVNVAYAGEEWANRPWRFALSGNRAVSRPWPWPRTPTLERRA